MQDSQTFDDLINGQVNETLQRGSMATSIMGFGSSIILFALIYFDIVRGIEAPVAWAFMGGVYSSVIWLLARANKIRKAITWFVMLGFCCFPTFIYVVAYFFLPSGTATYITGPPGYLYFFMIVLTGFAFDFRLSLVAGVLCAIQFSIAAELAGTQLKLLSHPDPLLIQDFTQLSFYHFKSLTMLMSGVTVGIISKHVHTLISDSLAKQKESLMVSRLFGQFVSSEVKDKILTGSSAGERKSVAILFSDIRGFTTFSENVAPEEVVEYLNEYLDRMVAAINTSQGTIDKFIGDAIMAVFGGVLEVKNSCDAAVSAALAMRSALKELNSIRISKGLPPIENGIGIHFGEVVQGAIGSTERKDFTVIGDAVNTASRIESLCKDFKTDLLFSQSVYDLLSTAFKARSKSAGDAQVKGRTQPIALWTIA